MTPDEQEYQDYLDYQDYTAYQNGSYGSESEPSFANDLPAIGGRAAQGTSDLINLAETALSYNPVTMASDYLYNLVNGKDKEPETKISEYFMRGAKALGADPEADAQTTAGKIAGEVAYYAPGFVIPGGSAATRAASIVGGGTAAGIGKAAGADETTQALLGLGGSLSPSVFAPMARSAGSILGKAANKLDLSAFGANKTTVKNAIKRMPDVLDDSGNFQNPINDAIESFKKAGGAKSMKPEALLDDLATQQNAIYGQLDEALAAAQAKQVGKIKPRYTLTENYINQLPLGKEKARAIYKDIVDEISQDMDGSILSLNEKKKSLGQVIKETAWGQDTASQMQVNITKRVRADLRRQVESAYQQFTGDKTNTIKKLNQELGKRETLEGLFRDKLAGEETQNVVRKLTDAIRTTGGYGSTMLLGGALGGLPGAMVGPVVGKALNSPAGKKALGSTFRSGQTVSDALGSLGGSARESIPRALGQAVGRTQQEQQIQLPDQTEGSSSPILQPAPRELIPYAQPTPNTSETQAIFERISGDAVKNPETKAEKELLLDALKHVESRGNTKAVSPVGAQGAYQIMPSTAKAWGLKDPFNEAASREVAGKIVDDELKRFGTIELALAAYNAGAPAVQKAIKKAGTKDWDEVSKFLPLETQKYVPSIEDVFARLLEA